MEIRAEMAATVWQVRVSEGDEVSAGQELIILESMKMEVPVEAPVAGVVDKILVTETAAIAQGDVLVILSPRS